MSDHGRFFEYTLQDPFLGLYDPLKKIDSVKFSPKEIDILSCIISGKTNDQIANFFSISARTVESHIRSISNKITAKIEFFKKSRSKKLITDFLEKSDQYLLLKNHYLRLLNNNKFTRSLRDISLKNGEKTSCLIVHSKTNDTPFIKALKHHFELAGIQNTFQEVAELDDRLLDLNYLKTIDQQFKKPIIFVVSKNTRYQKESVASSLPITLNNKIILINVIDITQKPAKEMLLENCKEYYFLIFNVLKALFPRFNISPMVENFQSETVGTSFSTHGKITLFRQKNHTLIKRLIFSFQKNKWHSFAYIILALSLTYTLKRLIVNSQKQFDFEKASLEFSHYFKESPHAWPIIRTDSLAEMAFSNIIKQGFIQIHSHDVVPFLKLLKMRTDYIKIKGVMFLDEITIERARELISHFPHIERWGVTLKGLDEEESLYTFLSLPQLNNLVSLNLWNNNIGINGAKSLGRSNTLSNLLWLDLGGNNIKDEGVEALVESESLQNLKDLNLWDNQLSDAGVKTLASKRGFKKLSHLNLGANKVSDQGIQALASSSNFRQLEHLNLWENNITSIGASSIAKSSHLSSLKILNIGSNKVSDDGAQNIITSIYLDQLYDLNFYHNKISQDQAKKIEQWALQKGVRLNIRMQFT